MATSPACRSSPTSPTSPAFYTKVIAANTSEAAHVLDGLLYHDTGLAIEAHYTDTGGVSDHVFGLCHLFGFRFAPRMRDSKERKLYLLPDQTAPRDAKAGQSTRTGM